MKKYPLRSCPICGNGKESEILHTQAFKLPEGHVLSGYDKYDVVACDECGFVYADTKAGQQLYDRYYRDMSKYESDYTTVDINRYMDQAELIYSLAGKNALKVADIGCGNGGLLQALRLKGFNDVCGIDPSAKCIEYIKSNGIKAYQGGLFSLKKEEKFGLIILSHVLEHIVDVKEALASVMDVLQDDGLLYVEVPDSSAYFENPVVPFYYFDTEHINHFEPQSLINLGIKNGLRSERTGRRMIDVSAGTKYPAAYSMYRKQQDSRSVVKCNIDSIRKFIAGSVNRMEGMNTLEETLRSGRDIYVWGAGNYTMRLLDSTPLGKFRVKAFIDKDPKKIGMGLAGSRVYSPDRLREAGRDALIIICSALFAAEIKKEIQDMGLANETIIL